MHPIRKLLLVSIAVVGVPACSMVPDYDRPGLAAPTQWSEPQVEKADFTAAVETDWWANFDSAELNALIEEANRNSPTMEAALARIEQARAGLRGSRSSLFPNASGSGDVSRRFTATDARPAEASWGDSLGLSVGYEADLFGANRASVQGAEYDVAAEIYDTEATALVLQADIATTYFTVLALKERLRAARANLAAAERILDIVEVRREAGAISTFDLVRQEGEIAGTRASVATLEQQLKTTSRALAILVGRPPETGYIDTDGLSELALPLPALSQPSALLERRPDLKTAEAGLRAANADIGVARAAFYPQITLSVSGTISGMLVNPTTLISSLAAGLAQPIFTAGALESDLEATRARYTELAANYRNTVLTAFGETLDALTAVETSTERAVQLRIAADRADRAFEIARRQYDSGAIDLLELLDAQRSQLDASDTLVQGRLDRLLASIDLFRALGGSWRMTETG